MDLTKAELAMLVLIVKLRVIDLIDKDKAHSEEIGLLAKLKGMSEAK